MERLTEWVGDGTDRKAIARQDRRDIGDKDCVASLAAYEDTGLAPEDIEGILERGTPLEHGTAELMKEYLALGSVDDLEYLAQAKKDRRLIVCPCKLGDIVYWVHNKTVTACRVYRISKNRRGLLIGLRSTVSHGDFSADCIGQTIFLTREKAEAALREADENA